MPNDKMIKRMLATVLIAVFLLPSCAGDEIYSSEDFTEIVSQSYSPSLGVAEVGEFYKTVYFNNVEELLQIKVYKSLESSNFDEIGVLEFVDSKSAKSALGMVEEYLKKANETFKKGIVYNAEEYVKFQGSKVERFGNILVYTILEKRSSDEIFAKIKRGV